MFKFNSKLMSGVALCSVLLAGCSGDNDNNTATNEPVMQNIKDVPTYISNLFAGGENTDPVDANFVILAADDATEPAAIQ